MKTDIPKSFVIFTYARSSVLAGQQSSGAAARVAARNIDALSSVAYSRIFFTLVDVGAGTAVWIQRESVAVHKTRIMKEFEIFFVQSVSSNDLMVA